ncbi:MAG: PrgI family protein [Chloroflexota bacterium]
MQRIYELPTHLQVEDVLIAGLTARQLVRLMIGASLGYGLWDQAAWLPQELRFGLAVTIALAGLLVALVQPGGRPLDQWLLAGVLFMALPRRLVWRPGTALLRQPTQEQSGWAELALNPEWAAGTLDEHAIDSEPVSERRVLWWSWRS